MSGLEHFVGVPLIRPYPFFAHDHCLHPPDPPDEEPPEPVALSQSSGCPLPASFSQQNEAGGASWRFVDPEG